MYQFKHHQRCNIVQYGKEQEHDCDCGATTGHIHGDDVIYKPRPAWPVKKAKPKKEYVHVLQDCDNSPGKILGVYASNKLARDDQKQSDAIFGVRYTAILKFPLTR